MKMILTPKLLSILAGFLTVSPFDDYGYRGAELDNYCLNKNLHVSQKMRGVNVDKVDVGVTIKKFENMRDCLRHTNFSETIQLIA
jgi:hypothetical protein